MAHLTKISIQLFIENTFKQVKDTKTIIALKSITLINLKSTNNESVFNRIAFVMKLTNLVINALNTTLLYFLLKILIENTQESILLDCKRIFS